MANGNLGRPEQPARHDSKTLWRLIDARCAQIGEAVIAARTPLILSLIWAFIWATALYAGEFSWADHRLQEQQWLAYQIAPPEEMDKACDDTLQPLLSREPNRQVPSAERLLICRQIWNERLHLDEQNWQKILYVSPPGGFGTLSVSDLGVVGSAGLLLLLSWHYLCVRRENYALRAFVDRDRRWSDRLWPRPFTLRCSDNYLSSEHVAYAYESIKHKFVFLFHEGNSFRLPWPTFVLSAIPALVVFLNWYSDYYSTTHADVLAGWLADADARTEWEFALLLAVVALTFIIRWIALDTSILLNGWELALREVWISDWDETHQHPAPPVYIDTKTKRAYAHGQQPGSAVPGAPIGGLMPNDG